MTERSNAWQELVREVIYEVTRVPGITFDRDAALFRHIELPIAGAVARLRRQTGAERDNLVIFVPDEGWSTSSGPDGTFMGIRLRSADIDWPVVGMEVQRVR